MSTDGIVRSCFAQRASAEFRFFVFRSTGVCLVLPMSQSSLSFFLRDKTRMKSFLVMFDYFLHRRLYGLGGDFELFLMLCGSSPLCSLRKSQISEEKGFPS